MLPDICRIAYLKYYSEHEIQTASEELLKRFLRELCEKQVVFSFYLKYPQSWLMEVMLYDKCIVEYRAKKGSQVMIEYKIQKARERTEDQAYQKEIMQAAYEGIHIRTFVLYSDEILEYRFKEMKADGSTFASDMQTFRLEHEVPAIGTYGRLNDMSELTKEALKQAMNEYSREKELSQELFMVYQKRRRIRMENCGYIIGYDLNENGCQISYYDEEKHELKTLEVAADNYQIPMMVGHYKEAWMFGREAQRAAMMEKGWVVSDLYRKAQRKEQIEIEGKVDEARWLLGKVIEPTLQTFRKKEVSFV